MTFGEHLRALMADRGMSLRQLAKAGPYDAGHLSKIQNGHQAPSLKLAKRLEEVLDAPGELVPFVPVKGRRFGAAVELTPDDEERLALALDEPARVDANVVKDLAAILAAQRRLDDTVGPAVLLPSTVLQTETVLGLLKHARGAARDALAPVAGEYLQFAGWLRAELRQDGQAVRALDRAEELADEIGDGTLAAQASNFKGWLARQQGKPRAVVRHFLCAHHTPGAHPAQQLGDAVQAAQGYALLGEREEALRLLDRAERLRDRATRELPPGTAYWLSPTFHGLNIGLALMALGRYGEAARHLADGFAGLPDDQQSAEWTQEYQAALAEARQRS